jgi:glycosyltransferase involved in cell wall biosynthesis
VDEVSFYLSAAWALWCIAGYGTVVVAKTDPPMVSLVAAPIARLRGAGLVNWLQDLFPEVGAVLTPGALSGRLGRLLRRMRNASLHSVAVNVVLGERMAARLRGEGIPAERVQVIHHWADGEAITPIPHRDNPLRAEGGLEGRFVVGYSGDLGRAHEFGMVLEAADRLREEADIVFLFVGGGHYRRWVETEARPRQYPVPPLSTA